MVLHKRKHKIRIFFMKRNNKLIKRKILSKKIYVIKRVRVGITVTEKTRLLSFISTLKMIMDMAACNYG